MLFKRARDLGEQVGESAALTSTRQMSSPTALSNQMIRGKGQKEEKRRYTRRKYVKKKTCGDTSETRGGRARFTTEQFARGSGEKKAGKGESPGGQLKAYREARVTEGGLRCKEGSRGREEETTSGPSGGKKR